MRKTFFLILVGMILGSTGVFAASKLFPDVPENTWYTNAVTSLSEKGIMNGYPDGTFGPEDNVNRAELATSLYRLIDYIENGASECSMARGQWESFPNTCVDSCYDTPAGAERECGEAETDGCNCGPDKCWDSNSRTCISN